MKPSSLSRIELRYHALMINQYITPNLGSAMRNIKIESTPGKPGGHLTGSLNLPSITIGPLHDEWKSFGWPSYCDYNEAVFNPSKGTVDFTINNNLTEDITDAAVFEYKSDPVTCTWDGVSIVGPQPKIEEHGKVELLFKWKSKGQWSGGTSEHPNLFQLTMVHDSNWTISATGAEMEEGLLDKIFNTHPGRQHVPPYYNDLKFPPVKVEMKMKALDYFLTTNLLFPGENVFYPHQLSEENRKAGLGLAFPRDMILTGEIRKSRQ
ncbi:hypothetical protein TRIATDRAFT_275838 [Trichoderma atroviride IMI 206040]|uniref:Uncharacterized protein n=1 Tax=Hypocrea atroviridis (strain ATCC 20476 / IMI 206040) TaxID=452589 RepID=G9P0I2_HYPAI|nr:uncharacterized protein TRIATDRAFT_275838 [Trichoderma atroviride IMI 206040]EHK42353.1 hypothetical protein TRIATDRAFT_275838 [Trichoderma atroviride IMI 206040]